MRFETNISLGWLVGWEIVAGGWWLAVDCSWWFWGGFEGTI